MRNKFLFCSCPKKLNLAHYSNMANKRQNQIFQNTMWKLSSFCHFLVLSRHLLGPCILSAMSGGGRPWWSIYIYIYIYIRICNSICVADFSETGAWQWASPSHAESSTSPIGDNWPRRMCMCRTACVHVYLPRCTCSRHKALVYYTLYRTCKCLVAARVYATSHSFMYSWTCTCRVECVYDMPHALTLYVVHVCQAARV
jgi:hypothetical protein